MAQKIYGRTAKLALIDVHDEPVLMEALKKLSQVSVVGLPRTTENQNVVQVDEDEIEALTNRIHQSLECLSSILKAKRHSKEFEEAKWRYYSSFGDVIRLYWNLMITAYQIYF